MNFVISYVQYIGKTACYVSVSDRLSVLASFQDIGKQNKLMFYHLKTRCCDLIYNV